MWRTMHNGITIVWAQQNKLQPTKAIYIFKARLVHIEEEDLCASACLMQQSAEGFKTTLDKKEMLEIHSSTDRCVVTVVSHV